VAIAATVLALNAIGEGLRRSFDRPVGRSRRPGDALPPRNSAAARPVPLELELELPLAPEPGGNRSEPAPPPAGMPRPAREPKFSR